MKTKIKLITLILAIAMLCSLVACGTQQSAEKSAEAAASKSRTIVDSRGVRVNLPDSIERVAIIDKGFIVQCMTAMGINDKIVAQGDLVQTSVLPEERDTLYLCPKLLEIPNIGYPTAAVDYEALASSKPDIVIFRNSEYIKDSEITEEAISKIENDLKLPLIVIDGPGCNENPTVEDQYKGIRLMGEIFNMESRAEEIVSLMDTTIDMISERTKDIPDVDKPSVMFISGFTNTEVSGTVWGGSYGDAKFSDDIVNTVNVYPENDSLRKASAEQLISLNPDVIVLCTMSCEPEDLLTNSAFSTVQDINAIKNQRVVSRGLLTWWGDFRLEVPTIMLITAKGVYPEYFEDINVGDWLNEYHMELYGLTEEQAQEIKVAQGLEWMDKSGF